MEEKIQQLEIKVNQHIDDCNAKFSHIDARAEKLIASQERCTLALEKLAQDTSGIVDIYSQAQTAIRLGSNMQRFGLWLVKWPLVGAGLYTAYSWLLKYISVY